MIEGEVVVLKDVPLPFFKRQELATRKLRRYELAK